MKPKGIKLIELVADKVFLGVFALLFLVVTAAQFLGGGEDISIGNDTVSVDRAYDKVVDTAQGLQAQMRSKEVDPRVPSATADLVDLLERSSAPAQTPKTIVALGLPFIVEPTGASVSGEAGVYALPAPPAPGRPVGRAFGGALDPYVIAQTPEIADSLLGDPNRQPFDLFAVSVQASFNADAYRRSLQADPDGAGDLAPIPRQWWRNRLEVLDVQVTRRQVFADGSRGPGTLLAPMPARPSLRPLLDSQTTVGQFNSLVKQAHASARMIRQPSFYRLIAGQPWIPPIEKIRTEQPDARYTELLKVRREISKLEQQLDKLRQQASVWGAAGGLVFAEASEQVSKSGGGGKGKARRPKGDGEQRRKQQREQGIKNLSEKLDSLHKQEGDLVAQLVADGIDPETGLPAVTGSSPLAPLASLRDADEITVWAHDVHVEPGAVYEYQVRLVLPNPLMGYEQSMGPAMRQLGEIPTLTTAASPWSEPVAVPKRAYMFVDRAALPAGPDAVGDSRAVAEVELYRFFYGYWRKGRARVHPGDLIGASIALAEPMPVWDIAGSTPTEAPPITEPIPARTTQFLLDVVDEPSPSAPGPANRGNTREAVIIGAADGSVSVRRPDLDASSSLRQTLDSSAQAGQRARVGEPDRGLTPIVAGRPIDQAPETNQPATNPATKPATKPARRRPGGRGVGPG